MGNLRNISLITAVFLLGTAVLTWIGLRVEPKSFQPFPEQSQVSTMMPLPDNLPAPVERFYTRVYGDEIPVINSVVILGRGTLKPFMNIPMRARFVFVHIAGMNYRHYFEATWFGIPIFKVNEGYIDSMSYFENPMVRFENNPNNNQAANLTLWAEGIWFPSLWVTDPRVHWEAVDEDTALLCVPFENSEENILVRFNPETGLIDTMEAMRYRDTGEDQPKILWILQNEYGKSMTEDNAGSVGSAMWLDQGSPWAYFDAEKIIINADVSKFIRQSGY